MANWVKTTYTTGVDKEYATNAAEFERMPGVDDDAADDDDEFTPAARACSRSSVALDRVRVGSTYIQAKLGLSERGVILHLFQSTSNMIERRFGVLKYLYGGTGKNGKRKEKTVNKHSGTHKIIMNINTCQLANQDYIERQNMA